MTVVVPSALLPEGGCQLLDRLSLPQVRSVNNPPKPDSWGGRFVAFQLFRVDTRRGKDEKRRKKKGEKSRCGNGEEKERKEEKEKGKNE